MVAHTPEEVAGNVPSMMKEVAAASVVSKRERCSVCEARERWRK